MKIVLIIGDGMADRAVEALGFKTPLQVTEHRNLDALVRNGSSGTMDTIDAGVAPGSDTAHLALLGHNPYEIYSGRGPFEAAGVGIEVRPGDVAFRANFSTVDANNIVIDRRAGRIKDRTAELAKDLNMKIAGVQIICRESTGHRAALVLRGKGLGHNLSDTDPHKLGEKVKTAKALDKRSAKAAKVLNEFMKRSRAILETHPVNIERKKQGLPPANSLLTRGVGVVPTIEKFEEKYGIKGSCVCGTGLIAGVMRACGLETILVPKGGDLDSDLIAKANHAISLLKTNEFCLLHVKGTDNRSHDGDVEGKKKMIGKLDEMIGFLTTNLKEDAVFAVCADHSTPLEVRDHTADPVPLCISGRQVRKDGVQRYDEISCSKGALGRIKGTRLIHILLDLAGKSKLYGA